MNQWNVGLYEDKHSYVWEYGKEILQILAPQPQESILDLGCGTGQLTAAIATTGARVIGLDAAESAIAQCRLNYPQLEFILGDGANFSLEQPVDAVFSNAALHWMHPPEKVAQCIYQALKPGGRLVAEFGGQGNIQQIITALNQALAEPDDHLWYFPSIGEYSTLLEQQGFKVRQAVLFPRPTKLAGQEGLANWLEMFASDRLKPLTPARKIAVIEQVEAKLKPSLYHDNHWWADYWRIRVLAEKEQ